MKESYLADLHRRHGALLDPEVLVAKGEAFLADCDLDRHDESGMLRYVKERYGLEHAFTFQPTKFTAGVVIPSEGAERKNGADAQEWRGSF